MVDEPDDELIEFATRLFGLARAGETAQTGRISRRGRRPEPRQPDGRHARHARRVPRPCRHGPRTAGARGRRANDRGQTPLAGAVFKAEAAVLDAVVAGGADPQAGTPSAVATAQMFARTDLLELLGVASGDPGATP
jgi:hypothetical protein